MPGKAASQLIAQLQGVVLERRRAVALLSEEGRRLRLRSVAGALALLHCSALLDLGRMLERGRLGWRGSTEPGGGRGGEGGADAAAWQAQILLLKSQMEAVEAVLQGSASAGAGGPQPPTGEPGASGCGASTDAPQPRLAAVALGPFQLNWSPEGAAAARLAGGACSDLSTAAFRALLVEFAQQGGCLVPRIRQCAPDAAQAVERLKKLQGRFLEFMALLAVGEGRHRRTQGPTGGGAGAAAGSGAASAMSPVVAVVLTRLDESGGGAGAGAGIGGNGAGSSSGDGCGSGSGSASRFSGSGEGAHDGAEARHDEERRWAWALSQADILPEREELLFELLCAWRVRSDAISARRDALLALCGAPGAGADAHEDLAAALEGLQAAFELNAIVFSLAIYGSLLTELQVASLLVAAWPCVPSLHALHAVLDAKAHAARDAGERSQAAAPDELPVRQGRRRRRPPQALPPPSQGEEPMAAAAAAGVASGRASTD